jgi:hypothetical protein
MTHIVGVVAVDSVRDRGAGAGEDADVFVGLEVGG